MTSPLRFLAAAVIAWVGVRAAGGTLLPEPMAPIAVPPPRTALLDPQLAFPEPTMAPPGGYYPAAPAGYPLPPQAYAVPILQPQIVRVPVYYPAFAPVEAPMSRAAMLAPEPMVADYAETEFAEAAPMSTFMGAGRSAPGTLSFTPAASVRPGLDRLSLTGWALMRQTVPSAAPSAPSLSPTGTLGGSQAGVRLSYNFNRALALKLRASGPADREKFAGEAALGIAWQPLQSVPVRLLAERRKALGEGAGRDAFALLAEGGVYDRQLPWQLRLDGYAQAGVVGAQHRDLFADGGFAVTRPLLGRFALGAGAWGGIQPGLSRFDVGPRLSMRLHPRIRAHLDYRYKVTGNALPPSGPALTLGADF